MTSERHLSVCFFCSRLGAHKTKNLCFTLSEANPHDTKVIPMEGELTTTAEGDVMGKEKPRTTVKEIKSLDFPHTST